MQFRPWPRVSLESQLFCSLLFLCSDTLYGHWAVRCCRGVKPIASGHIGEGMF
jgi:hypothetical protein